MGNSWLDKGKAVGYVSTVLQLKAGNEKATIRLLDDSPPVSVWRHATHDSYGKFVKALCVGDRNGCRLCKENEPQRLAGIKPKDQYHPKASEYVKAVWVYEEKRPMLVVGNDIWKQLDVMFANGVNLTNRDFSIVLTIDKKRYSYQVISLTETPFTVQVDPASIPTVEAYTKYLTDNIERVATRVGTIGNGGGDSEEKPAVPSFLTAQVPQEAPAAAAPAAPQSTGAVSPERQALNDDLAATLIKSYVSAVATACQNKVLETRKAISPNCHTSVDYDKMSDLELKSFLTMYKKEVKIQ